MGRRSSDHWGGDRRSDSPRVPLPQGPRRRDAPSRFNVSSACSSADADTWCSCAHEPRGANGVLTAGLSHYRGGHRTNTAWGRRLRPPLFAVSGPKEGAGSRQTADRWCRWHSIGQRVLDRDRPRQLHHECLGPSYSEAQRSTRGNAFVPMLSACKLFAGNALTGIGHHRSAISDDVGRRPTSCSNLALIEHVMARLATRHDHHRTLFGGAPGER